MTRLGYGLFALALTWSGGAAAQTDEGSDWFDEEVPAAEEPATTPVPDPPKAPTDAPAARPAPTVPPAERRAHEHDGSCWHGKHGWRSRRANGSRSLSLTAGRMRLDAPELVSALENAGFDDPTALHFVGLQGTRVLPGRVVLGLGGTFAWSERFERADGAAGRMRLMQLRGNLGYALVHTDKWLLYPAIEVGLNRAEIDIGAPGASSFDGALAEPRTGTELVKNSVAAGGAVAIERRFAFRRRNAGQWTRYFAIGLRAGWIGDVVASPWRVDGDGDAMGPEERHTIKYIGLTLGFGQARF